MPTKRPYGLQAWHVAQSQHTGTKNSHETLICIALSQKNQKTKKDENPPILFLTKKPKQNQFVINYQTHSKLTVQYPVCWLLILPSIESMFLPELCKSIV